MKFNEIIKMLAENQRIYIIASANKAKIEEYKRLIGSEKTIVDIEALSALLDLPREELDSLESERNSEEIALGKVVKIQNALKKQFSRRLTAEELNKFFILGDDYGASAEAIKFSYDEKLSEDVVFEIIYNADNNKIAAIHTSKKELDDQGAPGYFAHRIMESFANHFNLTKKDAFRVFAEEMIAAAQETNNFNSSVTVAVAHAIGLQSPQFIVQTVNYPLVERAEEITEQGFDFDRIQKISANGDIIANLTPEQKDALCIRGQLVKNVLSHQSKKW